MTHENQRPHIVLVGDSIFDNKAYVEGGCSVREHLQDLLGDEADVTLLAVDGSFANEVPRQLEGLPAGATHIFMSAGGNDALATRGAVDGYALQDDRGSHYRDQQSARPLRDGAAEELEELPATGGGILGRLRGPNIARIMRQLGGATHLLDLLAVLQGEFRLNYRKALGTLEQSGLPVAVCTVYDSIPDLHQRYRTALSLFNDLIIQEAATRGLRVIDLRAICREESDYAPVSPIEPSDSGGRKVAAAIERVFRDHPWDGATRVYV